MALVVKNLLASAGDARDRRFDPWVWNILWSRKWHSTPVFLLENSMARGAWWATVHGVSKSRTQLSD